MQRGTRFLFRRSAPMQRGARFAFSEMRAMQHGARFFNLRSIPMQRGNRFVFLDVALGRPLRGSKISVKPMHFYMFEKDVRPQKT